VGLGNNPTKKSCLGPPAAFLLCLSQPPANERKSIYYLKIGNIYEISSIANLWGKTLEDIKRESSVVTGGLV